MGAWRLLGRDMRIVGRLAASSLLPQYSEWPHVAGHHHIWLLESSG